MKKFGLGAFELRWLEIVSSTYISMGRYNHTLSLDATIMLSTIEPAQPLVNTFYHFHDIIGYHSNSMTLGAHNSETAG